MPVITTPVSISHAAGSDVLTRGVADASQFAYVLAKRAVDHGSIETIVVILTLTVGLGALYWWGIKNGGSWKK